MAITSRPTWATTTLIAAGVGLVAACLVWCYFLSRENRSLRDDVALADRHLADRLDYEATWRHAVSGKVERLLAALTHANCGELEAIQQEIAALRKEIQ